MSDSPVQQASTTTASEQRSNYEATPVVAVVSAVADAAGTDPLEFAVGSRDDSVTVTTLEVRASRRGVRRHGFPSTPVTAEFPRTVAPC